jgi:hypothetical protein
VEGDADSTETYQQLFNQIIHIFKDWTEDIAKTKGEHPSKLKLKFAVENTRAKKTASNCLCAAATSFGADGSPITFLMRLIMFPMLAISAFLHVVWSLQCFT